MFSKASWLAPKGLPVPHSLCINKPMTFAGETGFPVNRPNCTFTLDSFPLENFRAQKEQCNLLCQGFLNLESWKAETGFSSSFISSAYRLFFASMSFTCSGYQKRQPGSIKKRLFYTLLTQTCPANTCLITNA